MKIYIHREGDQQPDAVEMPGSAVLGEVLARGDGGVTVAQLEDTDLPLDLAVSVQQAGVEDRAHVFVGTRERLAVEVLYNGDTREHEFSVASTVRRAFTWAVGKHGFDLSRDDASEHTLALCADGVIPAEDVHLGSLNAATPGRVCFMLIAKHRFEG